MMPPTCLLCLLSPFSRLSTRRYIFAFPVSQKSALRDVNHDFAMWRKILIFAPKTMANDCTDIDVVLRQINQRLRKLEKSDSEKTEEIGRLNRVINRKDMEIHNLKTELASTKAELAVAEKRIKELEGTDDDTSTPGKPEKNSSNSSIPPSQESIAARELRRTSLFASQAESRAVDSLATRVTHCRL